MQRTTYLIIFLSVIIISVLGGTFVFSEPSWPGILFYLIMFAALMILAGHWLLKSKY